MIKTICICDRCKKDFPQNKSKKIIFKSSSSNSEYVDSKLTEWVNTMLNQLNNNDYCPECVSEIKKFMKKKEG